MIKAKNYSFRFAFLFSLATALLFGGFLFEYGALVRKTQEAKTASELLVQARKIILEMDRFDSGLEEYFYFPRYKIYEGGLFKKNSQIIFSNMGFTPALKVGYNTFRKKRYFVYELPEGKYFGADYLVVSKDFYESEIYVKLLSMLLIASTIMFVIHLYLIKLFERPLMRMNQRLDAFIKDSIHEINTPLTIITTNVELFALKNGDNKHLSRIKAAAKSLSNLYDDMEYLIKSEMGNFEKERVDLGEALLQRVEYFDEIAKMKGISFNTYVQDGIFIEISRSKLFRIFDNNLSNAIKYSNENSEIVVSLEKISQNKAKIFFKDFGIGIENPNKIFERYYREESAKGGFGLGLNIVRNICEEERIDTDVKSTLGQGSEFTYVFTLPSF